MLPSMGFFEREPCPFYKSQGCDRPHCFFRHKRVDNSNLNELFSSLEKPQVKIPYSKESQENKEGIVHKKISELPRKENIPSDIKLPSKVDHISESKISANEVSVEVTELTESNEKSVETNGANSTDKGINCVESANNGGLRTDVSVNDEKELPKGTTENKEVIHGEKKLSEKERNGIDKVVKFLKSNPSRIDFVVNLLESLDKCDIGTSSSSHRSSSHASNRRSSRSSHRSRSSRSSHKSSHEKSRNSRSRDADRKRKRESESDKSSKHRRTSSDSSSKHKESLVFDENLSSDARKPNSFDEDLVRKVASSSDESDGNDNFEPLPEITDDEEDHDDDIDTEKTNDEIVEERMKEMHDFEEPKPSKMTALGSKRRVAHETSFLADHDMLRNRVGAKKVASVRHVERQPAEPAPNTTSDSNRAAPLHSLLGAPKARISAVPNAQRMLAAKMTLQKTIESPEQASITLSRTVKPGSTRQEHKPLDDDILRPVAPPGSLSVPQATRQSTVMRLYTELKHLTTKNERRDEALRMEAEIFQAHKDSFSKYRSGTVSAILRAKRGIQRAMNNGKTEAEFYRGAKEFMLTEEELIANGFPMYLEEGYATCHLSEDFRYNKKFRHIREAMEKGERYCTRCSKTYQIDPNTGEQTPVPDACVFHSDRSMRRSRTEAPTHKCCNSSIGCQSEPIHVTDTKNYQRLPNCVRTAPKNNPERFHKVLALDCEMVSTRLGTELAQIVVVDSDCHIVYEELVKPYEVVESYNTAFSGMTEERMKKAKKTLRDVQRELLAMISEDTILVGHSLDSDLRAMHLIHGAVCDTSYIYRKEQDAQGNYFKMRLKDLSANHLGKIIQEGLDGHNAAEDAIAAMQLLLHKVYPHLRKKCTHCS